MKTRVAPLAIIVLIASVASHAWLRAQAPSNPAPQWTDAEMEHFLSTAHEVGRPKGTKKGVTGALRVTLSDGTRTHDAQVQTIDISQAQFQTTEGMELNFRDSWKYNVAAYRLDRLIGLNLIPVTVQRTWGREEGAVTWWIDDVMMDEGDRVEKKLQSPDPVGWNKDVQLIRILDQLIANVDRNQGNLLITKDWRLWPIDHTRSFRLNKKITRPASVTKCDRAVLEKLKALDKPRLEKVMGALLTSFEIQALLARRDEIASILENAGPSALFDRLTDARD